MISAPRYKFLQSPGLPRGFCFAGAAADCLDLRPMGLIGGDAAALALRAGLARPLAGGPMMFTACEVFLHGDGNVLRCVAPVPELAVWAEGEGAAVAGSMARAIDLLSAPRPSFAGLSLDRPRIMGVVNVTPDSFSDGGDTPDATGAIARGAALHAAGADIIDIGGESTRPGSDPTSPESELARVLPVIRALAGRGVAISIDTRRAAIMDAALDAGARVVNDITALAGDPAAIGTVARHGADIVLMHMQGRPRDMQANPDYGHAPYEVMRFLAERVAACGRAGIPRQRIAVDPGIGFGKNDEHNLKILAEAAILHATGCAVAVGASRKSFIGRLAGVDAPKDRLPGSLAAASLALGQGVQIFRVHDVAETRQALAVLVNAF